jgi:hypothetical protein
LLRASFYSRITSVTFCVYDVKIPTPESVDEITNQMILPFVALSVFRICIFLRFVFILDTTCAATNWYSNIFSRGSESFLTASVKYRNETATSSLTKMLQQFYVDPQKNGNRIDLATNCQRICIGIDCNRDRETILAPQSLTDTVSVSFSHPNTTRPTSSSSWFTNVTSRMIRTLSWVALFQSIDRLLVANDFDVANQVSFVSSTQTLFKYMCYSLYCGISRNCFSPSFLGKLLVKVLSQESIDAVKTIRSILSDVHTEHGVVDVFGKYNTVDVLASILALSRLQSVVIAQEQSLRDDWIEIASNDESVDLLQDLAHFSVYAQAAYGWPMDLALRQRLHWGGHRQALVRLTGIDQKDIVKAEWNARAPHRPAYFIVRDHSRHSIVLCIRGT